MGADTDRVLWRMLAVLPLLLSPVLLSLPLLLGGSACAPTVGASAKPCNDDGDCAASQRCQAGACAVASEPSEGPLPADDAGAREAGRGDAGFEDAGPAAGLLEAGIPDAGIPEAGVLDAGVPDAGALDAGVLDAGARDAGLPDAGPSVCVDDADCPADAPFCEAARCVETLVLEPVAAIAACLFVGTLDPAGCPPGDGQVEADLSETNGSPEKRIFLRFDVGPRLEGRAAVSARLRMTAANVSGANSNASGEVWLVDPFDEDDLALAMPAGLMPLAPDQGPVAPGQVVEWDLDVSGAGWLPASVHFGVFPTTSDGVRYLDATAASPPVLRLEVR